MPNLQHSLSQQLAARAQVELRNGNTAEALDLYAKAADQEEAALARIPPEKARTFGLLAMSLCALLYKARLFGRAERTIYRYLCRNDLPPYAQSELRRLLEVVWDERVL